MPFVEVRDLVKQYRRPDGHEVLAVDNVSLAIQAGDSVGVIGESGSGKSTLARLVLRLIQADSGSVTIDGTDALALSSSQLRNRRREWQIVFQEPFASLDPRMKIRSIVAEPLAIHEPRLSSGARDARVVSILEEVGLSGDLLDRRPASLSGGQQQRVGIARALITNPSFLVLDEPTASLDMTIRASVLGTLQKLRASRGLTYLLISHDITTVETMCTHVAVMHRGRFVEQGTLAQVLEDPQEAYTQRLISARLTVDDGAGAARRELATLMASNSGGQR